MKTHTNCGYFEYGLDEHIIGQAVFFDKGYAFFRSCMDRGIDTNDIVDLLKFMRMNNIHDSRDMTKEMWKEYISGQNHPLDREELISMLENTDEIIHLPDLMDVLENFNGIVLTGGGIHECLREVEIALKVLEKNYEILSEFTY